jgi:redox-sensitive bicupin YhaK (pirin superfamily)
MAETQLKPEAKTDAHPASLIAVRPAEERGRTELAWLDSRHTFSFGDYRDPAHMGFSTLRVINDDRVTPGGGFGTHGHRDMEIVTYVIEGQLAHKDSLGNGSIIRAGEIQRMSAGTGIRHSEFNASQSEPVRFLQIWILPERINLEPGYGQIEVAPGKTGLHLAVTPDGSDGTISVHQDARVFVARLAPGGAESIAIPEGRHAWVQVAIGAIEANGRSLKEGDGAAFAGSGTLTLSAAADAEALVFDLA